MDLFQPPGRVLREGIRVDLEVVHGDLEAHGELCREGRVREDEGGQGGTELSVSFEAGVHEEILALRVKVARGLHNGRSL